MLWIQPLTRFTIALPSTKVCSSNFTGGATGSSNQDCAVEGGIFRRRSASILLSSSSTPRSSSQQVVTVFTIASASNRYLDCYKLWPEFKRLIVVLFSSAAVTKLTKRPVIAIIHTNLAFSTRVRQFFVALFTLLAFQPLTLNAFFFSRALGMLL